MKENKQFLCRQDEVALALSISFQRAFDEGRYNLDEIINIVEDELSKVKLYSAVGLTEEEFEQKVASKE